MENWKFKSTVKTVLMLSMRKKSQNNVDDSLNSQNDLTQAALFNKLPYELVRHLLLYLAAISIKSRIHYKTFFSGWTPALFPSSFTQPTSHLHNHKIGTLLPSPRATHQP